MTTSTIFCNVPFAVSDELVQEPALKADPVRAHQIAGAVRGLIGVPMQLLARGVQGIELRFDPAQGRVIHLRGRRVDGLQQRLVIGDVDEVPVHGVNDLVPVPARERTLRVARFGVLAEGVGPAH